jgi:hypothetical protein
LSYIGQNTDQIKGKSMKNYYIKFLFYIIILKPSYLLTKLGESREIFHWPSAIIGKTLKKISILILLDGDYLFDPF